MRFHLLTVDGARRTGNTWVIAPSFSLRNMVERWPKLMVPMAGEAIELRLPDGRVAAARIASFGADVWMDSAGKMYIKDPSAPSLTLTSTCDSDVGDVPLGTDVWLEARFSPGA